MSNLSDNILQVDIPSNGDIIGISILSPKVELKLFELSNGVIVNILKVLLFEHLS